ncbi:MAG: JAB domain-containing protein [Croceibacterium sp.]
MAALLAPFAGDRSDGQARRLIERFGGLGRALSADVSLIEDRELADACMLVQAARRLTESALREELAGTPVTTSDPTFLNYLHALFADVRTESFYAVFLDTRGLYLSDELLAGGDLSQVRFRARQLFHRALELGAAQIVLAHNHPSGDSRPSEDDIATTDHLVAVAEALDLRITDHLIVTRHKIFSFKRGGLL